MERGLHGVDHGLAVTLTPHVTGGGQVADCSWYVGVMGSGDFGDAAYDFRHPDGAAWIGLISGAQLTIGISTPGIKISYNQLIQSVRSASGG